MYLTSVGEGGPLKAQTQLPYINSTPCFGVPSTGKWYFRTEPQGVGVEIFTLEMEHNSLCL